MTIGVFPVQVFPGRVNMVYCLIVGQVRLRVGVHTSADMGYRSRERVRGISVFFSGSLAD